MFKLAVWSIYGTIYIIMFEGDELFFIKSLLLCLQHETSPSLTIYIFRGESF